MTSTERGALWCALLLTAMVAGCGSHVVPEPRALEAAYRAARDSAIRSLVARVNAGEPHAKVLAAHDSTLISLTGRLRDIIGPVQTTGFSESGRINLDDLFPEDLGFGKLDALVFNGRDQRSNLWVTTRGLVSAWIEQQDRNIPHDLDAALRSPKFYTTAIESEAAVYSYANVSLPDARELDVAHAFLMLVAQDDSPSPPDELVVTVVRGRLVYIVDAPAFIVIPVPPRCAVIRDSLRRRNDDAAETAYRKCYGERVPSDPTFATIVTQVRSIAAALPRQRATHPTGGEQ